MQNDSKASTFIHFKFGVIDEQTIVTATHAILGKICGRIIYPKLTTKSSAIDSQYSKHSKCWSIEKSKKEFKPWVIIQDPRGDFYVYLNQIISIHDDEDYNVYVNFKVKRNVNVKYITNT